MEVSQVNPVYTKKNARKLIEATLQNLSDLQKIIGEKKFNRRIKKAGRLLTDGLPKSISKKKEKAKKTVDTAA